MYMFNGIQNEKWHRETQRTFINIFHLNDKLFHCICVFIVEIDYTYILQNKYLRIYFLL